MPQETFSKPIEEILNGQCIYEYYNYTNDTFSTTAKTRICHVELNEQDEYNRNIALMIFTIRNQSGKWKIHSEGAKRTDPGSTVPLRKAAVKLAKNRKWKYVAAAVVSAEVQATETISQYVVSIESYSYGNETVCDLTNELQTIEKMGLPDFYRCKVETTGSVYSLAFIKKNKFINYLKVVDDRAYRELNGDETQGISWKTNLLKKQPYNRIIFGAPGTGKSFQLNGDRKDLLYCDKDFDEENEDLSKYGKYERVTFHPDYTYANFVGTYKPVPADDDTITYEYVPGPFMRILVRALKNCMNDQEDPKPYLLIIEEINRANVAAVFGDIFQLLDRDEEGVSEYPVQTSQEMRKYIADELGLEPEQCSELKIPDNMFIWATMNSADQGVFPMDTAFKRRWDFEYLGIDNNEDKIAGKIVEIGKGKYARKVEWNLLRKEINEKLAGSSIKLNEDKLLGPFFISLKDLGEEDEIDADSFIRIFKNKVIMYLFDDAAKQKRTTLFSGCDEANRNIYSKICKDFDEKGVAIFGPEFPNKFESVTTAEEAE